MTKAASEAGLIDGSLTQQKQEQALYKLMENGKLISSEVLPHFGDALKELANNGNAVAKALENNLAPQLGRSKNVLTELANEIYKGLKPAMRYILDGFADLGKEGGNMAYMFGKVLSGAMFGFLTPIRFVTAAIVDLSYWIGDLLNLSEDTKRNFVDWLPTIVGVVAGVKLLTMVIGRLLKTMTTLYKVSKLTKEHLGDIGGKGGKSSGKNSGGGSPKVTMKDLATGAGGLAAMALSFKAAIASAIIIPLANMAANSDMFKSYSKYNQMNAMYNKPVKVDVSMNVKGTDGLVEVVDTRAKVISNQEAHNVFNEELNKTYNSIPSTEGL